jgi:MarR family transcriptional regulator for hemolysin
MQAYDFEESLGYWLTVTHQAYHRAITARLLPQGVTYRQSLVVGWLALKGELTQADLARKMLIEPPTLVRLLDRMEAAGLVQRWGDPDDRRRRIVRLTATAEPVWDKLIQVARKTREQAATGLSAAEQALLNSLLQRVLANLEKPIVARPRKPQKSPS